MLLLVRKVVIVQLNNNNARDFISCFSLKVKQKHGKITYFLLSLLLYRETVFVLHRTTTPMFIKMVNNKQN